MTSEICLYWSGHCTVLLCPTFNIPCLTTMGHLVTSQAQTVELLSVGHFVICNCVCVCVTRVEEQTITSAELITQDIDINEPVGNLKKLLEPRLQIPLEGYEICLQDIHVCGSVALSNTQHRHFFCIR